MVTIASGFTRGKRWHAGQALTCIAWSPHGRSLVVAGDAAPIEVWDVQTGSVSSTYTGHTDIVTSISWSPCGRYLASAIKDSPGQGAIGSSTSGICAPRVPFRCLAITRAVSSTFTGLMIVVTWFLVAKMGLYMYGMR
jgi:WD40 repeat protein